MNLFNKKKKNKEHEDNIAHNIEANLATRPKKKKGGSVSPLLLKIAGQPFHFNAERNRGKPDRGFFSLYVEVLNFLCRPLFFFFCF
jgi:hypothetical protein